MLVGYGCPLPYNQTQPELPDSFLSGSAPLLQSLTLSRIPFLGLPKLLLSCNDLVYLDLWQIPNSGYISPELMVTTLSTLTRLRSLIIGFENPSSPDQSHPPPLTRAFLPSLTVLRFQGGSEYLEDLVARINSPLLQNLRISLLDYRIFGLEQLHRFISHSGILRSFNHAKVTFGHTDVIALYPPGRTTESSEDSEDAILRMGFDGLLSSVVQICRPPLSLMSSVEHLVMANDGRPWSLADNIDNAMWPDLFRLLPAVLTLRISSDLRPFILSAFQEFSVGMATEVLPARDWLYVQWYEPSGSEWEAIKPFITARQTSDHPVTVRHWDGRLYE
jgi:hypothetical protein